MEEKSHISAADQKQLGNSVIEDEYVAESAPKVSGSGRTPRDAIHEDP